MSGSAPASATENASTHGSVWRGRHLWVTVGAVALIFLAAIQALAVTTVMPVVSEDLDGERLFAVAFAGMLATSVVGMVAAGAWCDRRGVLVPLTVAVALFVSGLVIAGLSANMDMLVAGRLVQGLGSGGQIVALYVLVARVYPSALHGRVFAAFSAAWVVPSLIGPFLAGAVAEILHWRWVFLGVAILTLLAFVTVVTRLHGLSLGANAPSQSRVLLRLLCAVLVAVGALGLSLAEQAGRGAPAVVAASIVLIVLAARPLLPRRTLIAGRGLPSVILMRGVLAGALFGAEIYVPFLLRRDYGFSPVWAGLALTAAALAWAVAAEVQGRIGDVLGNRRIVLLAIAQMTVSFSIAVAAAAGHLHPAILIVGWALAGSGMGLVYPRLSVLMLAYSGPANQGFNSSALSISDAIGSSSAIATMGLVFLLLTGTGAEFPAVFGVAVLLTLLALVPGLRLGRAGERT